MKDGELSADFFENNSHALRMPNIVLRDSLGTLAVQILSQRPDFSKLDYGTMLNELENIIIDLHDAYDDQHR